MSVKTQSMCDCDVCRALPTPIESVPFARPLIVRKIRHYCVEFFMACALLSTTPRRSAR